MKKSFFLLATFILAILLLACQSRQLSKINDKFEPVVISKHYNESGSLFQVILTPGKYHNHPSFAIWLEDMQGHLIQTIFVTQSIAKGYFKYGDAGDGTWLKTPGEAIRPATLPYWLHKREGVEVNGPQPPSPDNPFPDAYTGATPPGKLILDTKVLIPQFFRLVVEVNQPWDWNNYWTNDKYIDNISYKTSAQPSVIYAVTVNLNDGIDGYHLNPIGHGRYDGSDGLLYTDLSTLSTALDIFNSIIVNFR